MATKVNRLTVDLSQYLRLVVIYLGMRVNRLTLGPYEICTNPRVAAG
jgi:hypothetical protein